MYQYLSFGMLDCFADLNLVLKKVILMHVGLQDYKKDLKTVLCEKYLLLWLK